MSTNYQVLGGTVFENFDTIGDWTASGTAGGSLAVSGGGLQVTTAGGAASNYAGTKTISQSFSNYGVNSIDVTVPDTTKIVSPTLYLSSTSDFSKFFSYTLSVAGMRNGLNRMPIHRNGWSNTGGEDWGNTMIRMRVRCDAAANQVGVATFDNFVVGRYNRPKFIFRFDDNRDTVYTNAYPIMRAYGFRGSVFVIRDKVGIAGGYMTQAQLNDLHANGWDMSNHTCTHTDLSTQDAATQINELTGCSAYLSGAGFTRRNEHLHLAFPFGGYDDNLLNGMKVSKILTGNMILSPKTTLLPIDNPQLIAIDNIAQNITLSSALSRVDRVISDGGATLFLFHVITSPAVASTEWDTADFQSLCDYLSLKRSQIDVVTWTEFLAGANPPGRKDLSTQ